MPSDSSAPRGVIYIVGGAVTYLREAAHSARTVQAHTPGLPRTLFTSLDVPGNVRRAFDAVHRVEPPMHPLKAKVRYLAESPYAETLFLDCDTEVRGDLTPLFDALGDGDFALCHAPDLRFATDGAAEFVAYESAFYNTGVFLFRRTPAAEALLADWYAAIEDQDETDLWPGHNCDQTRFNEIIGRHVERGLRLRTLPNTRWNARTPVIPQLKNEGRLGEVMIYHGRPPLSQPWKGWLYDRARWVKQRLRRLGVLREGVRLEHLLRRRGR